MSENSCRDLKMERFRLVLRSFNEGGWKATQTTISISSAISFQPNFAGLLKLPQEIILFCIFSNEPSKNSVILSMS